MEPAKEPEPEEQEPEEPRGDTTDESDTDDQIIASCRKGVRQSVDEEPDPVSKDTLHGEFFGECWAAEPSHDSTAVCDQTAECPSVPELQDGRQEEEVCQVASGSFPSKATPHGLRWRWWRREPQGEREAEAAVLTGGLVSSGCSDETADVAETIDSERWAVVNRDGTVLAEDDGLPLTTASVEANIEQLLTWMLAPAVHGISKLGVPSAAVRADELLAASPGRDVDEAAREVVAGSERTVSSLVSNFCLERIPFLGCPTVLLKNTWGNLRSILIIAALYGHDLEKPRTQHEALLCLLPPDDSEAERRKSSGVGRGAGAASSPVVNETAQKVARMMIKGALKRATGLQAAVDCFELAALLYNNWFHESVDEDGYVCVVATPASAARDFFRRRSLASSALLWCSLPLLLLGMCAPHLMTVARCTSNVGIALRELSRLPRTVPAMLLALPGLFLALHTLSCAGGGRLRRISPVRFWHRLTHGREAQKLQDAWPQIVTMAVFTLHALLPAISAFSAVNMVLDSAWIAWGQVAPGWDRLHGLACVMLGFYSFSACVTQYLQSEKPDAISSNSSSQTFRRMFRSFSTSWAVMRACCILAAWTYTLLALDLAATCVEKRFDSGSNPSEGHQTSALGIVSTVAWLLGAQRDGDSLWSEMAIMFLLRIISVSCQQRLIDLLSRREVLLRLIGAERITAQTVCLLLKGIAVACSQSTSANPIQEFFESVTPPPVCCVLVVAARTQAVILGAGLAIAPRLTSSGALSLGSIGCFACGLLGGAYATHAVLCVWYENQGDLESPALRLALLIPGSVSGKARDLLSGAIAGVQKRAVQMMAMGIIRRFIRWCLSPTPALTNA